MSGSAIIKFNTQRCPSHNLKLSAIRCDFFISSIYRRTLTNISASLDNKLTGVLSFNGFTWALLCTPEIYFFSAMYSKMIITPSISDFDWLVSVKHIMQSCRALLCIMTSILFVSMTPTVERIMGSIKNKFCKSCQ